MTKNVVWYGDVLFFFANYGNSSGNSRTTWLGRCPLGTLSRPSRYFVPVSWPRESSNFTFAMAFSCTSFNRPPGKHNVLISLSILKKVHSLYKVEGYFAGSIIMLNYLRLDYWNIKMQLKLFFS